MRSRIIIVLLFVLGLNFSAQAQLNEYKYIIVPKKFAAFKGENKYQTSTLVKFYLTKYGFNVVYDDALPMDLATNRCLGLVAEIIDNSSMFSTKVNIALTDCKNVEVFRSMEGISKLKEYEEAYKQAIKEASISFSGMNYHYEPKKESEKEEPVTISFKDDVKSVEEMPKKNVVEQKATTEEQIYKSVEPKPSNIVKAVEETQAQPAPKGLLYAQPVESGYQLVDSTPKVVLKLQQTSMENVFLTKYNGKSGLVFQKDGKWFLEYSEDGKKLVEELNIKF